MKNPGLNTPSIHQMENTQQSPDLPEVQKSFDEDSEEDPTTEEATRKRLERFEKDITEICFVKASPTLSSLEPLTSDIMSDLGPERDLQQGKSGWRMQGT